MNRTLRHLLPAIALIVVANSGRAQTSQKISIQGSGLVAMLFGDAFTNLKRGYGGELQLRYTPGTWSLGGGVQYTAHDVSGSYSNFFSGVKLSGVFVEPRYVVDVGSSTYAPYLSGRFAFSKMKFDFRDDFLDTFAGFSFEISEPTGPTINGGGGVLVRLGSRANLDLGVTVGYTQFKNLRLRIVDDSGTEVSNDVFEVGSGMNAVFRLGLAFGLGG